MKLASFQLIASDRNLVYNNEFIENNDNGVQAYDDTNTNQWSNGTHGNFWSDYNGIDLNKNGIGDTSYRLDGEQGAKDPYPILQINVDISQTTESPGLEIRIVLISLPLIYFTRRLLFTI